DLTALRVERDPVDRAPLRARVLNHEVAEADHVSLRSRARKNGTPSTAVTAPSGSSAGGRRVRATMSDVTTSVAPIRALANSIGRCRRAPIIRARRGTTSPTTP